MVLPSKVSFHLRTGGNNTNMRSESLLEAFEAYGVKCVRAGRDEAVTGSELVVQTGFAASHALRTAIDKEIPYIIMEAPFWRHIDVMANSSWGYNGLAGCAWRPIPPDTPREKPTLQPMKTEGNTLIIGQKPTDHSLRGSDHVEWLLRKFEQYPDADFRPHPLMVSHGTLQPLPEALQRAKRVITFTSTVGAEALIDGSESRPENAGSIAFGVTDRERWLHALSWAQAAHTDMGSLAEYILSGYEEARGRASNGLVETPRERVDGQAICQRYYQHIIR